MQNTVELADFSTIAIGFVGRHFIIYSRKGGILSWVRTYLLRVPTEKLSMYEADIRTQTATLVTSPISKS